MVWSVIYFRLWVFLLWKTNVSPDRQLSTKAGPDYTSFSTHSIYFLFSLAHCHSVLVQQRKATALDRKKMRCKRQLPPSLRSTPCHLLLISSLLSSPLYSLASLTLFFQLQSSPSNISGFIFTSGTGCLDSQQDSEGGKEGRKQWKNEEKEEWKE